MTVQERMKEWRLDTPNGTFTIMTFKPKRCITCGKALCSKNNRVNGRVAVQCKACNNREFAAIGRSLMQERALKQFLAEFNPEHVTRQTIYLER